MEKHAKMGLVKRSVYGNVDTGERLHTMWTGGSEAKLRTVPRGYL